MPNLVNDLVDLPQAEQSDILNEWKAVQTGGVQGYPRASHSVSGIFYSIVAETGTYVSASAQSLGFAVTSFWGNPNSTIVQVSLNDLQSVNTCRYENIEKAVESLSALDEDDNSRIDQDSSETGLGFLKILDQFCVPPPEIFSHGGDSLVFKWDSKSSVRYITTANAMARLREYKTESSDVICTARFDLRSADQVFNLITMLGGKQWKMAALNNG